MTFGDCETRKELHDRIKNVQEVVYDEYTNLINAMVNVGFNHEVLADKLEVSKATVHVYLAGKNAPHNATRKVHLKVFKEMLS